MNDRQKGSSVLIVFLVLGVIGVASIACWFVLNKQKHPSVVVRNDTATTKSETSVDTSKTTGASTETSVAGQSSNNPYAPKLPSGWKVVTDGVLGVSYAIDPLWTSESKVSRYDFDTPFGAGWGSPVRVKYNSQNKKFESGEIDVNGEWVESANSDAKVSSTLVAGQYYTATRTNGDGGGGQLYVMFVAKDKVYEVSLPSACSIKELCPSGDYTIDDQMAKLTDVILSISLK